MTRIRKLLWLGAALLPLMAGLPGQAAAMETRPLLYSLLLPGLGEWSLGYRGRAVTQFAIEAGSWAGNFYYRDKGFDLRHEYEVAAPAAGLTSAQTRQAQRNALAIAFLSADERVALAACRRDVV